jgi:hypothetical protein
VTSGQVNKEDAGQAFDSEAIIPNQYYSITFDGSGEYPFIASIILRWLEK